MHGDLVRATVLRRRRGKLVRLEGHVTEVLERHRSQLLGTVRRGHRDAYLIPQDSRVLYHVTLADTGGAEDGDMVVAEITRYPGPYEDIAACVTTVLGPATDPRVEIEAIIHGHDLPRAFPARVEQEAAAVPAAVALAGLRLVAADDPAGLPAPPAAKRRWHASPATATRVDLRTLPLVTIDGESARDFDDAVAILDGPAGGTRLLVAIADVGAYVPRGGALDAEARARGTSVYFPDRVLPMLPEALSNGICSLNPGVDRLVQAVLIDCDHTGAVLGAAFFPGLMQSRARLTYTAVREIVVDRVVTTRQQHAPLVDGLERMVALGERMAVIRHRRGSIDLDVPEAEIILDLRGKPENIGRAERNAAHRMIESFMLAANEAVARFLTARRVPMPYRIHEPPDEEAVHDLARFLAGFGIVLRVEDGTVTPATFQRVLARVAGRPEERLVNTILLRSMQRARYAPVNAGHFGLAATCYTHFTSPIRRYPDLVLHRILAAELAGDGAARAAATADLGAVCEESSTRERVAMDAERQVVQLHKVQFMAERIGETFDGHISGVAAFGFFVEMDDSFVDGLVHVATLTDDRYELVEHQHLLRGRRRRTTYRLGDAVRVRVAGVSIERRQVDLVVA
jgi:ribonuclease R